jgi:DNA invertase Pin-like site-specific DNA recombinase
MYGYVRVSTDRQETGSDAQRRALAMAGCKRIVEECASGRKERPVLAALVGRLQPGDILAVYRFDRISRSVADFYRIGECVKQRGASLRSLVEYFDTGTAIGKAMMGFAAVWAELEADTTRERVKNGLKAARARGVMLGRPPVLSPTDQQAVAAALAKGKTPEWLAKKHGVSSSTIRRTGKSTPRIDS